MSSSLRAVAFVTEAGAGGMNIVVGQFGGEHDAATDTYNGSVNLPGTFEFAALGGSLAEQYRTQFAQFGTDRPLQGGVVYMGKGLYLADLSLPFAEWKHGQPCLPAGASDEDCAKLNAYFQAAVGGFQVPDNPPGTDPTPPDSSSGQGTPSASPSPVEQAPPPVAIPDNWATMTEHERRRFEHEHPGFVPPPE